MRELGSAADEFHRQLGSDVVTLCGADMLVVCGEHAAEVAASARRAGMPSGRVFACRWAEETLPYVRPAVRPGDVILIKGSRAMAMEQVVAALESQLSSSQAA